MKLMPETAGDFRCARWDELPTIPLYMDQVMLVTGGIFDIFSPEGEKAMTPTMINNYVKQKLISPPEKKKYGRGQLAGLVMITILKKVLTMAEIGGISAALTQKLGMSESYDLFCCGLEATLKACFCGGEPWCASGDEWPMKALGAAFSALGGKLLVQYYIAEGQPHGILPEKSGA